MDREEEAQHSREHKIYCDKEKVTSHGYHRHLRTVGVKRACGGGGYRNCLSHRSSMVRSISTLPSTHFLPLIHGHGKAKSFSGFSVVCAKKRDLPEIDDSNKGILPASLRVSSPVFAQAAIAVFGLGFVDAGYSGDWSRIGAISKQAEDLLKIAAFVVVPLCIFAIISISKQDS